mmetsp:Transcript_7039/g.12561  ORF Transcript_7039/g.12561 Transcript_7039/m.12561 type:complete len:206 (-) Transcript_7039:230-847(-)
MVTSFSRARRKRGKMQSRVQRKPRHQSLLMAPLDCACSSNAAAADVPPPRKLRRWSFGHRLAMYVRPASEGPPTPRRCSSLSSVSRPSLAHALSVVLAKPNGRHIRCRLPALRESLLPGVACTTRAAAFNNMPSLATSAASGPFVAIRLRTSPLTRSLRKKASKSSTSAGSKVKGPSRSLGMATAAAEMAFEDGLSPKRASLRFR